MHSACRRTTLVDRLIGNEQRRLRTVLVRYLLLILVCLVAVTWSANAGARSARDGLDASPALESSMQRPRLRATQGDGMSLSEAIDSVRRGGNVERIISAETKISGGREVHHIKVLTKDGKVKTHTRPGRKRN